MEVVTQSTKDRSSSPTQRKVVTQSNEEGCRDKVNKRSQHSRPKGLSSESWQEVITQSTEGGCRHQVRKKGMRSPSRQEVVTQSNERVAITKSAEGRHTVDLWGCRHHVREKWMLSPGRQEVVTQSTEGAVTTSQPRSGDTKSTQGKVAGRIN